MFSYLTAKLFPLFSPNSHETTASKSVFYSAFLGNMMDHYATALYGFMAPIIAPLFFPQQDPIVALIFTYGLMASSLVTRPLGAVFFGKWSGQKGGKDCFALTLTGLALATGGMGFIPGYDSIGIGAPFCFVILRMIQGFFAAGETTVARFFILHNTRPHKHGKVSGYYGSTTILGELIASFVATLVSASASPQQHWRWPFIVSFLIGAIGVFIRYFLKEGTFVPEEIKPIPVAKTLWDNKAVVSRIVLLSGLTYITYSIPFIFMNGFVPHVSQISLTQMMGVNTALLLLDMLLSPLVGAVSDRFSRAGFMIFMSLSLSLTIIPLFTLIPNGSLVIITGVRIWIVLLGLGINIPFAPWFLSQIKGPERYLVMGVGYSIGSELFGRNAPTICLWLWHQTGNVQAPAIYISLLCFLGTLALIFKRRGKDVTAYERNTR
jgi:MFS family permease